MRRPRVWQDFPGIRGRGMPRPYSKTDIQAIPRHVLHRTGRGDACVARGYGRIFRGFAGEACLAPTHTWTITIAHMGHGMPRRYAYPDDCPYGARHASPLRVPGRLPIWGKAYLAPAHTRMMTCRGDACVARDAQRFRLNLASIHCSERDSKWYKIHSRTTELAPVAASAIRVSTVCTH